MMPRAPETLAPPLLVRGRTGDPRTLVCGGPQFKVADCIVWFSPTPRVIWTRLARPLNERMLMPADEFGQELVISDVQLEDSGHYQCSASNSLANPITHVITLNVQCQLTTSHFQSSVFVVYSWLNLQVVAGSSKVPIDCGVSPSFLPTSRLV